MRSKPLQRQILSSEFDLMTGYSLMQGATNMSLSRQQIDFLTRRRSLLQAWRYLGLLMFIAITCLVLFLLASAPLLINPFEVIARLESASIEPASLEMMAVLVPILCILICSILMLVVAMVYAAFSNEKKYLDILDDIDHGAP
ncbi:MAG: hypothetical protein WBP02_11775 [Gammaproteobacteria bacterium]|jgi:uncharacterized membrane protein YidH (DUF202 family)